MKKSILISLLSIAVSTFSLCGCGNKVTEELDVYKASMETFFENIAYLDTQINALDGHNDSDVDQLLSYLDTLDQQMIQLADLAVPEDFANVDDLADEASQNMTMAVSYFHQAYEGESFNQNYADAAFEYYSRANLRINYIIKILHGEEITDPNVVYTIEDDDAPEEETPAKE